MKCREFKNEIDSYLNKTMDFIEKEAFEEHFKSCPKCSEILDNSHLERMEKFGMDKSIGTIFGDGSKSEFSLCLSGFTIENYVNGKLNHREREKVIKHIKECALCNLMVEDESKYSKKEKEYAKILKKIPDNIIPNVKTISVKWKLDLEPALSESPLRSVVKKEKMDQLSEFEFNDNIKLIITVEDNCFLYIIHGDEQGKISLLFPNKNDKEVFIRKNESREILGRINPPKGRKYFKIFLTKNEIKDIQDIDFEDAELMRLEIEKLIKKVKSLHEDDWYAETIKYRVI